MRNTCWKPIIITYPGYAPDAEGLHLTYRVSVNAVTYSASNKSKICGDLPEMTAFKGYAAKQERKSQYANYSDQRSAFSA